MLTDYQTILIVDDEPAARRKLESMLAKTCRFEQLSQACDGDEAVEKIRQYRPELVFMDIQMPGLNGLQVAMLTREENYQLILVTAFDNYAIEAFDTHAVDYLLKPVTLAKLNQSLEKVAALHQRIPLAHLQQLADKIYGQKEEQQLAVRKGEATVILNASEICYFETLSGYCRIVLTQKGQKNHKTDSVLSDAPLEFMHQQLDQQQFLRVHRKYVVNSEQIFAYYSVMRRMYLKIRDFSDVAIPVSRRNAPMIKGRWQTV